MLEGKVLLHARMSSSQSTAPLWIACVQGNKMERVGQQCIGRNDEARLVTPVKLLFLILLSDQV